MPTIVQETFEILCSYIQTVITVSDLNISHKTKDIYIRTILYRSRKLKSRRENRKNKTQGKKKSIRKQLFRS